MMMMTVFLHYIFLLSSLSSYTSFTVLVMAVDRSKFRTCDQTSFCRRHRFGAHQQLFQYKLLKDTVHLHYDNNSDEENKEQQQQQHATENDGGGGLFQSISRTLLGNKNTKKDNKKNKNLLDPYVVGPNPTVTGILQNTKQSSTYDNNNNNYNNTNNNEILNITLTCLQKGIIRIRIMEMYGTKNTPYEKARITYDELVLETDNLHHSGHALLIKDISTNNDIQQLIPNKDSNNIQNYMALQYGDDKDEQNNNMILLLQLDPFIVYLFRSGNNIPIVTLGADQMIHYEIRRLKSNNQQQQQQQTSRKDEEEEEKKEEVEEKEIVGYWEDGLAIYADGTREERKEVIVDEHHRHLSAAELDQEGLWEENFGSHKDSKPYGPMSVGMDIAFPYSNHIYGIPEHASSTKLYTTTSSSDDDNTDNDKKNSTSHYKEPYRLYNLDVFEYELDETMALYGHVPLIVSQSMTTGTVGVFWFNPTETFVDIKEEEDKNNKKITTTHWISESGIIDVFLLPGPNPTTLYRQYADLTGTTPIPPMFSLGYHQCRWNYKDEKDVYMVHNKFEELDYPYDVLWLDIEHTDGKRYFTWDSNLFPHPTDMINKLASTGRKMVTIIDPHIKRDDNYYVHKDATKKGLYIREKDNSKDYDGWCWPGSSSYLDFTAGHVRDWWASQFKYDKYIGSTPSLFTWNDMNEPSVFNGPEVSMQKDLLNLNGIEHREWHNLYGMLFHRATNEGLLKRNPNHDIRPFVLSRSFFAGSQRYGAIWTGDNEAKWGHLEIAAPMLLSLNIAALSFVGADVGGFFGNPDAELFTRWMQAGAYQPFFRGHAHHDSKRREPWMFDDDTLYRLRRAAMVRYALLPYWYTVFYIAETTGMPVMRTMWMEFPTTEELFPIDDQYMIGSDLLVKPITSAGVTSTNVLFPSDSVWYDAHTLKSVPQTKTNISGVEKITVPADIDTIPVFQRGGSILCRKLRLRRSTVPMKTDPYTVYVALDAKGAASGTLYMDDEVTLGYQRSQEYAVSSFTASQGGKNNVVIHNGVQVGVGWTDFVDQLVGDRLIERIVVMMGNQHAKTPPKAITLTYGDDNTNLEFTYTEDINVITIRKPDVSALIEWDISIAY